MPNEFLPKDSTDLSFEAFVVVEIIYAGAADPGGARGARALLKIKDLFSKFFGKRQILIFLFIRAPLRKKSFLGP